MPQRDDLETTKHHYRDAGKRYKIGVGGREEVYRWEAIQAQSESDLIEAASQIHSARVVLNQLMNRPQGQTFEEEDVVLETVNYYIGGSQLDGLIRHLAAYDMLIDYMVEAAFVNSPELKALQIGIEQQKEILMTAQRRFFCLKRHSPVSCATSLIARN